MTISKSKRIIYLFIAFFVISALTKITSLAETGTLLEGTTLYYEIDEKYEFVTITDCKNASNVTSIDVPNEIEGYPVKVIGENAFSSMTYITSITMPNTITSVGNKAFYHCSNLTSIQLSERITTIGSQAFANCTSLLTIDLPEDLTSLGSNTFADCTKLKSVVLPYGLKTIGNKAFINCAALTDIEIPATLTNLGVGAFFNCKSLERINIPKGVNVLPDATTDINYEYGVFARCTALKTVTFEEGSLLTRIGNSTFSECESLLDINIPPYVESIGEEAFYWCQKLRDLVLPDSLKEIGASAFATCWGIKSVVLPEGITTIGEKCFWNCNGIVSVTLPDTLTSIGNEAFSKCSVLRAVRWPASITVLPESVFSNCSKLSQAELPDGLTSIEKYAFYDCKALASISIPATVQTIGDSAFSGTSSLTSISIPDSVQTIGKNAFSSTNLKTVILTNKLESVGTDAFLNVENVDLQLNNHNPSIDYTWFTMFPKLKSITVNQDSPYFTSEEGVLYNKEHTQLVHYPCTKAGTTYTVPDGVLSFSNGAFYKNAYLTSLSIPDDLQTLGGKATFSESIIAKNLKSPLLSRGKRTLVYYNEKMLSSSYIVPSTVTRIAGFAFYAQPKLKTVTLPESIEEIGEYAFASSTVATINIPESCQIIHNNAFASSKVTSLTIPYGVKIIERAAFYNSALTSISLSDSIEEIGDYVFSKSRITEIEIPYSVSSLGTRAFKDCTSLTRAIIPDSIPRLGEEMFLGCTKLTDVTLAEGALEEIGESCFYGCSALTTFTIPEGVTSIGEMAFYNCSNLKTLYLPTGIENLPSNTLQGTNSALKLFCVPCSKTSESIGARNLTYFDPEAPTYQYQCNYKQGKPIGTTLLSIENNSKLKEAIIPDGVSTGAPNLFAYNKTTPTELTVTVPYSFGLVNDMTTVTMSDDDYEAMFGTFLPDHADLLKIVCYPSSRIAEWIARYNNNNPEKPINILATIDEEHIHKTKQEAKEPTCTEDGNIEYYICDDCGLFFSESNEEIAKGSWIIAALGHEWGTPTYEWSADNSTVTATRVCAHDETHIETETVDVTSEVTKFATCEAKGETTYTSTAFENEAFEVQTKTVDDIDALGHEWGEPTYEWSADNSKVTATRVCAHDAEHIETETVTVTSEVTKAATCEAKGETTYTSAAFTNAAFMAQTKTVDDVNALGHEWGTPTYEWSTDNSKVTATRVCAHDAEHIETETVDVTSEVTKAATCEAKGETTYTSAAFTNTAFEVQTKTVDDIAALGHEWGTPTYDWSTDNSKVTATRVCAHDAEHIETETVNVTSEVTKPATCEAKGETMYTSAAFTNAAFVAQTKTLEDVAALGHDWGEPIYEWSSDNRTIHAIRICKHDESHIDEETVGTVVSVVTSPTDETEGESEYASPEFKNEAFKLQTKKAKDIPALKDLTVMKLPTMLKAIGAESFANLACEAVIIPDGCTKIDSRAFAECKNLIYVKIPDSVKEIAVDAFEGCDQVRLDRK